jgi:imidazolonepropionase-like amidohydrolase
MSLLHTTFYITFRRACTAFPFPVLLSIMLNIALNTASSLAQTPTPAPPQSKPIYLVGATVHVGNGTVLENAVVGFDKGKLTLVGTANTAFDKTNADVFDVKGKHIYPGFFAPNTTLGLVEIEAVRSTRDAEEVGGINPHVRSLIAYNAASQITPTVRFNGVLTALVAPQGGLVSGRSSLVELDGWNWEDAVIKSDLGIHVNFPDATRTTTDTDLKTRDEGIAKQLTALVQFFREAQAYAKAASAGTPKEKNLRFEAMRGLFDGSKKLFIRADEAKTILAAVNFAKDFGLTPVIVGGADAYLLTDILKANNIPVMIEKTHSLPSRSGEDVDQPYKLPAQLVKAGVLTCLSTIGGWQQRNIGFEAGTAAAYGLSKEEALMLITANTAKILGVSDRLGTLELGKDATLFVSEGDALDMRGNNVEHAFIRGRKLQLVNKQKFLYEQYKAKYGQK